MEDKRECHCFLLFFRNCYCTRVIFYVEELIMKSQQKAARHIGPHVFRRAISRKMLICCGVKSLLNLYLSINITKKSTKVKVKK